MKLTEADRNLSFQEKIDKGRGILRPSRIIQQSVEYTLPHERDEEARSSFKKSRYLAIREEIYGATLIAEGKKEGGLPLTNEVVEAGFTNDARYVANQFNVCVEKADRFAQRHIEFTKSIQRRAGVRDNSSE